MKTTWEVAKFLITAKKCIDSLMYILKNENKLLNIDLKSKIEEINQKFYINLGFVLDEVFSDTAKKKEISAKDKIIDRIYYERDKNSAHKDNNYETRRYKYLEDMLEDKKKEINQVKDICRKVLPGRITLDFVPHDRELFRLVHRLNADIELDANKIKYPKGVFHSYDLSEEGKHVFKEFDTEKQARRNAEMFGYDYDQVVVKRKKIESLSPNSSLDDKEVKLIQLSDGINSYEGLQNRQDFCVELNIRYNYNLWATPNLNELKKIEELKKIGFLDEFELVHWSVLEDDKKKIIIQKIMEK